MAEQEPPLPENLAALIGSTEGPTRPPEYRAAWSHLTGWIRNAAKHGQLLEAKQILELMQNIHEEYHLPPESAPKRDVP